MVAKYDFTAPMYSGSRFAAEPMYSELRLAVESWANVADRCDCSSFDVDCMWLKVDDDIRRELRLNDNMFQLPAALQDVFSGLHMYFGRTIRSFQTRVSLELAAKINVYARI